VLPLAYGVHGRKRIDATASMVRHVADEPLDWRDLGENHTYTS